MKSFDEIFDEVMDKYDLNNWWDLLDDERFDEVVENIVVSRGLYVRETDDVFEMAINRVEGFKEWYNEMCAEL